MKNFFFLLSVLLVHELNAQEAARNCKRYDVSCFKEYFYAQSAELIIASPDTSYACSMQEMLDLNKFLSARNITPGKIHDGMFDIRCAFTYLDKAGVNHILGFNCYGDYYLDGKYYEVSAELKTEEKALKVGTFRI
jgi:hypothetical protein